MIKIYWKKFPQDRHKIMSGIVIDKYRNKDEDWYIVQTDEKEEVDHVRCSSVRKVEKL